MKHVYRHIFSNGDALLLEIDLRNNPPVFRAEPGLLVNSHKEEYRKWVNETVVPDLLRMATSDQLAFFALLGKEITK